MELELLYKSLLIIMAILIVFVIVMLIKTSLETKILNKNITLISNDIEKIKNNLTLIKIKRETIRNNFNCGLVKVIRVVVPTLYLIKALKTKKYYKASKKIKSIARVFG